MIHKMAVFFFLFLSSLLSNVFAQNTDSVTIDIEPGSSQRSDIWGSYWYIKTITFPDQRVEDGEQHVRVRRAPHDEYDFQDYWIIEGKKGNYCIEYRSLWGEYFTKTINIQRDTILYLPQMDTTKGPIFTEEMEEQDWEDIYLIYYYAGNFHGMAGLDAKNYIFTYEKKNKIEVYNHRPMHISKHRKVSRKKLLLIKKLEQVLLEHGFTETDYCSSGIYANYEWIFIKRGDQYTIRHLPCIYKSYLDEGNDEDPIRELLIQFGIYGKKYNKKLRKSNKKR